MRGSFDFDVDIHKGLSAESMVYSLLRRKYKGFIIRAWGHHPAWDIKAGDKTVEVKRDFRACDTGNYFIETKCNGKPSGITTSKSDIYAIVDDDYIVFINTATLEWLVKDLPELTYDPRGNDGPRTGKLLKRPELIYSPYSVVYNNPDGRN